MRDKPLRRCPLGASECWLGVYTYLRSMQGVDMSRAAPESRIVVLRRIAGEETTQTRAMMAARRIEPEESRED